MAILTLNEAKEFLKIDYIDEDNFLESTIIAAETYLQNATGKVFDNSNELAKLAVKLLVSNWYSNREIDSLNKNASKLSFSLDCILTQLRYCEGVET
jgi:uncharacterized phage protein (predicted DNA packaging)